MRISLRIQVLFLLFGLSSVVGCGSQTVYRYSPSVNVTMAVVKKSKKARVEELKKGWKKLLSTMAQDPDTKALLRRLYCGLEVKLKVCPKGSRNPEDMTAYPEEDVLLIIRVYDSSPPFVNRQKKPPSYFCSRNISFARVGDVKVSLRSKKDSAKENTFGADYEAFRLAAEDCFLRHYKNWDTVKTSELQQRIQEYIRKYRWEKWE